MRRLGVVLVFLALAAGLGPAAASAHATLSRATASEVELYGGLVVAQSGAGPALARAGGVKIASALPVWRLPSRSALRVLPGLLRRDLVSEVAADEPLLPLASPPPPAPPAEGFDPWIHAVGADAAVAPGPGKPLTIIDTGVDLTHEEFANRPATTALNAQSTSGPDEDHGTAVASMAAAPLNGFGMVGVYPQANLYSWDASPSGDGITAGDVIRGLDAAIKTGKGVVNLSLGSEQPNPILDDMIAETFASGTLVVAAAGNGREQGSPLEYPASLPHVLTVGALDGTGNPAYFSSGSQYLDLAAPGYYDYAAIPATANPDKYAWVAGTSFASPIVAGAADWVWTARPTLDVTQLFDVMRASAQDVSTPGWDAFSGFGRLNIPAALTIAAPPIDPMEPNEDVNYLKPNGILHRASVPLTTSTRPNGSINARLDFAEDPRDVYRIWIPAKHAAFISLQPKGGDINLSAWGPKTVSVLEGGSARKRDALGISERTGTKREHLRVANKTKAGAYYYVDAYVAPGTGNVVRRVAALSYTLSISTVKSKRARR